MSFYNILCRSKLFESAQKFDCICHLVPLQKLLCRPKNQFYWMQIIFLSVTKCFWLAQYVNKFLVRHKKNGLAQNILRPVKEQGIKIRQQNSSKNFFTNICHKNSSQIVITICHRHRIQKSLDVQICHRYSYHRS